MDGEDYFSRKGRYGIAGIIICDNHKRIRYIYTGWPGCAHDARIFKNSTLACQPDRFFSGQEYLLADSGFNPSTQIIPAFKRPSNSNLADDKAQFNFKLSSIRVKVEHCIGILKGWFQSLKGLRTVIKEEKDVKRLVYWIRACCVLHNLVLQDPVEPEWIKVDADKEEIMLESSEKLSSTEAKEESTGKKKREDLIAIVLSK